MTEAEIIYDPLEWTPCPQDCAYCFDLFYGHPHPHDTQIRLSDGKSASQVRIELKKSSELEGKLSTN